MEALVKVVQGAQSKSLRGVLPTCQFVNADGSDTSYCSGMLKGNRWKEIKRGGGKRETGRAAIALVLFLLVLRVD